MDGTGMGWLAWDQGLTLLAPVVAIGVALLSRRVVPSLALGVVVAAVVARQGAWMPQGPGHELSCLAGGAGCEDAGYGSALVSYVVGAVWSVDNLKIITFTVLVSAMVGVMGASGATATLVRAVERVATGPRGAMTASWLAGFLVFFDDYANCMVVGKSMGPVCDRHGVSRDKLAYIVDSTAAPVASLTLVSTWVGYEVSLLDAALAEVGRPGGGFELFVTALPYRFYGIFALALVGLIAWTGRDFGPMRESEALARGQATGVEGLAPPSWGTALRAAAPVGVLVGVTFAWMLTTGITALSIPVAEAKLYELLADAAAYDAMLLGSIGGVGVAAGAGLASGRLDGVGLRAGLTEGIRAVSGALVILYLAWSLGNAIGDTEAQAFLTSVLQGALQPWALPTATFLLAAFTAFATGTSFGTMSILIPLAVPLAVGLGGASQGIVAGTTAAVLAGACLGDHASPISDTTVLSAAGAGADLVDHVRTQLPYALLAGVVSIVVGYLPAGFDVSPWLGIGVGLAFLAVTVRLVGRPATAS